MKTIIIHIDAQLLEQIKQIAKNLNLTLSELVNLALTEKLKELQNVWPLWPRTKHHAMLECYGRHSVVLGYVRQHGRRSAHELPDRTQANVSNEVWTLLEQFWNSGSYSWNLMLVCSRMARPRIANPLYAGSTPVTDSKLVSSQTTLKMWAAQGPTPRA